MAAATQVPAETRALNPYVTYDPAVMQKSNTRWKKVWLVAAIVTAVAFTALATVAYLYTLAHFPIHVPIVSILVLGGGLPISFRLFKYSLDNKDFYTQEAAIDAKLLTYMERPTVQDPQLHSVSARSKYFQMERLRYEADAETLLEKIPNTKFSEVDLSDKKQVRKYHKQLKKQELARTLIARAALSQLKGAYFLYLTENPYEERGLSDFFSFNPLDATARLAAKSQGDKSVEALIRTSSRSYGAEDLLGKSVERLKQEIFEKKRFYFS